MDNTKLQELKKLALAATPGPWLYRHDPGNPAGCQHGIKLPGEHGYWVADCLDNADRITEGGHAGMRNAAYIAAANPAAVLELIELAERATAAHAESDVQKLADEFGLWSEQREKLVAFVAQRYEAGLVHAVRTIKNSNDTAEEALKQRDEMRDRANRAEAALVGWKSNADECAEAFAEYRASHLASRPAVDTSGLTVWSHSPSLGAMVNNSPRAEGRKQFYLVDDVQSLLAQGGQPVQQKSEVEKMLETNQLDELGAEVRRLQTALCFWLPSVTDREDDVASRLLEDAFLLVGIDGNLPEDFKSAQELGWISIAASTATTTSADGLPPLPTPYCTKFDDHEGRIDTFSISQVREQMRQARADALEEAAKHVELYPAANTLGEAFCKNLASAIRALNKKG